MNCTYLEVYNEVRDCMGCVQRFVEAAQQLVQMCTVHTSTGHYRSLMQAHGADWGGSIVGARSVHGSEPPSKRPFCLTYFNLLNPHAPLHLTHITQTHTPQPTTQVISCTTCWTPTGPSIHVTSAPLLPPLTSRLPPTPHPPPPGDLRPAGQVQLAAGAARGPGAGRVRGGAQERARGGRGRHPGGWGAGRGCGVGAAVHECTCVVRGFSILCTGGGVMAACGHHAMVVVLVGRG